MDVLVQTGIAAAAITAIIALLIMLGRGFRVLFKTLARLDRASDQLLGAPGVVPLAERIDALKVTVDEHIAWHSGSARERANGGRPR